ncbi:ABC transporter permease [Streptococcus hongkongensis]|nr:ABC transporter permease [Streptococcus uberis]
MFGKLLKYELKSIGKWYFAINLAILAIAGLLSATLKWLKFESNTQNTTMKLLNQLLPLALSLIFGALIAGSLLATLLIIINRFNKNVFGREGYLTMTLPVSEHQIILSKLLSSLIWSFFNGIILVFATLIMLIPQISSSILKMGMEKIGEFLSKHPTNSALFLTSYFLSAIGGVLLIYLAISIGQLFSNRRGLKAFIFYFLIAIATSLLFFFINIKIFNFSSNDTSQLFLPNYYFVIIVESIFEIITFYFATYGILKYKLNLQ